MIGVATHFHVPSLPLAIKSGAYQFAVALGQQEVVVDVPVTVRAAPLGLSVH
jgi:hypothetical protein